MIILINNEIQKRFLCTSKHKEKVQKGREIDKVAHYLYKNIDLMAHKG